MRIEINIAEVQHIKSMSFNIDLSENKLTCIVGKNGVGKTTLIKAIKNLEYADTFKKTSSDSIFNKRSSIEYRLDDETYEFYYDTTINSLNCKKTIPAIIKESIDVELPLPHGERFDFFKRLSDADMDIRKSIVLEDYKKPDELIEFMNKVYESKKFDDLVEIKIKDVKYYCITQPESRYIREDYLSSGEYLLISLYRKIKNRCKLIVIDEIDISLDAAAQVRLIDWLRGWCQEFNVNILFTTHSLAMMRTLEEKELNYMQEENNKINTSLKSYNYIKTVMFGFTGWDKYILTEDVTLHSFLHYIIERYCKHVFYKYHIIFIGTATSVADLLMKNRAAEFLSKEKNVIAVLDGDMRNEDIGKRENTYCIPFDSVEKQLYQHHINGGVHPKLKINVPPKEHKKIFKDLIARRLMAEEDIFKYLCDKNEEKIEEFSKILRKFLH